MKAGRRSSSAGGRKLDRLSPFRDGTFPPGAKLPSESELRQQWGVGAKTVRAALDCCPPVGVSVWASLAGSGLGG
jgi:regulatory GntR family protein